ncbi:hypothetical protein [Sphingomonas crusticola]|uniref:hypothetical protein n=1 Tax=Sphingomonas crusticola TaxID=1697973 RepID=UPI000E249BAE|nr:hypothetical protein [Sphingomonas crusticola]
MKRLALPLAGLVLVATPLQAVTIANPASDQLAKLTSLQRRGALRGALLDSGYACTRVEKAAIQGPWKNMIMWRAQCSATDPRYDYAVFVGPDRSIQARPCADLAELKLPRCRPFSATKPSRR